MAGSLVVAVGGAWAVGACASFGSSPPASAQDDGGVDVAVTPSDSSSDGAAIGDVTDASDAGADSAVPCSMNLMTDKDNCGVCGRQCGTYSTSCASGECEHLVFVTSTPVPANLGGLAGADARCTTAAAVSGSSRGNAPFKAWLSANGSDAAARFMRGTRRYVDKLGMTVAADWTALVSGTLERGIMLTETGTVLLNAHVRTATTPAGLFTGPSDCAGWSVASSASSDAYGTSGLSDASWTQSGQAQTCLVSANLYCIEQ